MATLARLRQHDHLRGRSFRTAPYREGGCRRRLAHGGCARRPSRCLSTTPQQRMPLTPTSIWNRTSATSSASFWVSSTDEGRGPNHRSCSGIPENGIKSGAASVIGRIPLTKEQIHRQLGRGLQSISVGEGIELVLLIQLRTGQIAGICFRNPRTPDSPQVFTTADPGTAISDFRELTGLPVK